MILLRLFISIVVIWLVFNKVSFDLILENLQSMSIGYFMLGVLVLYIHLIFHFFRWNLVIKMLRLKVESFEIFKLLSTALFLNQATPASIGADGVRIYTLVKYGYPVSKITNSVVIEKAIHLLIFFTVLVFGLYLSDFDLGVDYIFLITLFSITLFSIFLFFLLLFFQRKRLVKYRAFRAILNLKADFGLVLESELNILYSIFFSISGHLLMVLSYYLILLGLNINIDLVEIITPILIVSIVTQIPVSINGWGLREWMMVSILPYIGISTDIAFTASILVGLAVLISRFPGMYFLLIDSNFKKGGV